MTSVRKLMPLVALFVMLAGCTGGCDGREKPPAATPEMVTPGPVESPAAVPTPTPQESELPAESESMAPNLTETPIPAETPPLLDSPQPTPTPSQAPPARPGDAEVLESYQQAVEVFSWFEMETLPCDMTDEVQRDGLLYYRVEYPGITNLADLRGALKRLFSDELVDYLLPAGGTLYQEFEGVLYVQPTARGADITRGGEQRQVIWQAEGRCDVQVTVEILDPGQSFAVVDSETHVFPYQKVGSDWIFTNFYLVR